VLGENFFNGPGRTFDAANVTAEHSARWAHRAGSGSGSNTTSTSRATDRPQKKGGALTPLFSFPSISSELNSWQQGPRCSLSRARMGRSSATLMQKKGCSKAALRDLQCYQRLKTYIVTSKPKRISVYSGLVHMVRLLQRVNPLHRGSRPLSHDLGSYSVATPFLRPTGKH
jgi:hypothetical protein